MTEQEKKFIDYIKKYVGQPYVWGGDGDVLTKTNYISKINRMETNGSYGDLSYKDAAINFCNKLFAKGQTQLTVFDCSGYISKALMAAALTNKRRDCDGIWARCTQTTRVCDFALLFRVNTNNSEDETHVGVYYNGKQYHAKGRKYGVVCEAYRASYWDKIGMYPGLGAVSSSGSSAPSGYVFKRLLKAPMHNQRDVKELKKLLVANGYTGVNPNNGNFYATTQAVVRKFQEDRGLVVDGIAGKNTITALGGEWKN